MASWRVSRRRPFALAEGKDTIRLDHLEVDSPIDFRFSMCPSGRVQSKQGGTANRKLTIKAPEAIRRFRTPAQTTQNPAAKRKLWRPPLASKGDIG